MVVQTGQGVTIKNLIINTNPAKLSHPELLNPDVRKALEYGIDRTEIVEQTYLGMAEPGSTLLTPATGFRNEAIPGLPFDIDAANAILDGLGYLPGSDGVRVADGRPMKYEVIFPTVESGSGDRAFQTMQRGWEKIGIQAEQRKMDSDCLLYTSRCVEETGGKHGVANRVRTNVSAAAKPFGPGRENVVLTTGFKH